MLKISINARKVDGAYGGANQFVNSLEKFLELKGCKVYRTLVPNLDCILIITPTPRGIYSYDLDSIKLYKKLYPKVKVIHRANSSDEARGVDLGINRAMMKAGGLADATVFISSFLKHLFHDQGYPSNNHTVILNGADEAVFKYEPSEYHVSKQKLSIVTHHWSNNFMKGFDIYQRLDELLGQEEYSSKFDFSIIGNYPFGMKFKNTKLIPPLSGKELAQQLSTYDLYITAARFEAAGMHHVEAMQCGLPVLHLNSGALPEYCRDFGLTFTLSNFEEILLRAFQDYKELTSKVRHIPYSSSRMNEEYGNFIFEVCKPKSVETSHIFYRDLLLKWDNLIQSNRRKIHRRLKMFTK